MKSHPSLKGDFSSLVKPAIGAARKRLIALSRDIFLGLVNTFSREVGETVSLGKE